MSASGPKKSSWLFEKLNSFLSENDAKSFAATLMSGEQGLGYPAYCDLMHRSRTEKAKELPSIAPTEKQKPKM
ncbi:MAG: hypothetical protein BGO43_14990 [Gammaproteobacteria bacterium 39-13]|nr:hypothetical protein [Gammaproteobacteria bacterium]OJV86244.1 MAG: hypothetical protein BGO43_14990 [Gammaproteobacteria bacterium 39-13]